MFIEDVCLFFNHSVYLLDIHRIIPEFAVARLRAMM